MTKLSAGQVESRLSELPGWKKDGDYITRSFTFKEFMDGIAFVGKVARIAESQEHHPDIHIVWTTVTLRIQTHDQGGLTDMDFDLASEIERKLGQKTARTKKK